MLKRLFYLKLLLVMEVRISLLLYQLKYQRWRMSISDWKARLQGFSQTELDLRRERAEQRLKE